MKYKSRSLINNCLRNNKDCKDKCLKECQNIENITGITDYSKLKDCGDTCLSNCVNNTSSSPSCSKYKVLDKKSKTLYYSDETKKISFNYKKVLIEDDIKSLDKCCDKCNNSDNCDSFVFDKKK